METETGRIVKALSGFYYVETQTETVACRARGRFRREKRSPLVGDWVEFSRIDRETGRVDEILPRKNEFSRPAVANIDCMVIVASGAIPVTEPFLIDQMTAVAEHKHIEAVIVFNKSDLDAAEELLPIYRAAGFPVVQCSAATGEGIEDLRALIRGKVCVFAGNSGVGKSSILNALEPGFSLRVGEVSQKLGRGRHTTRFVELYELSDGTRIADTPGFASFDAERMDLVDREGLQYAFHEFAPYLGQCRFTGCAHGRDKGCAVRRALEAGLIQKSRYESYLRLYEMAAKEPDYEKRK